jgi:hypothetical protein
VFIDRKVSPARTNGPGFELSRGNQLRLRFGQFKNGFPRQHKDSVAVRQKTRVLAEVIQRFLQLFPLGLLLRGFLLCVIWHTCRICQFCTFLFNNKMGQSNERTPRVVGTESFGRREPRKQGEWMIPFALADIAVRKKRREGRGERGAKNAPVVTPTRATQPALTALLPSLRRVRPFREVSTGLAAITSFRDSGLSYPLGKVRHQGERRSKIFRTVDSHTRHRPPPQVRT